MNAEFGSRNFEFGMPATHPDLLRGVERKFRNPKSEIRNRGANGDR